MSVSDHIRQQITFVVGLLLELLLILILSKEAHTFDNWLILKCMKVRINKVNIYIKLALAHVSFSI